MVTADDILVSTWQGFDQLRSAHISGAGVINSGASLANERIKIMGIGFSLRDVCIKFPSIILE